MKTGDLYIVPKWIHFISVMILFGTSIFYHYTIKAKILKILYDLRKYYFVILRISSAVAIISGFFWLILSMIDIAGDEILTSHKLWQDFFLETSFGKIWIIRLVLFFLLFFIVAGKSSSWRFMAIAVTGAGLLISQAWLGHAAGYAGWLSGLAIASYAAHLLGSGAWLGGLVPLSIMIARARNSNMKKDIPVYIGVLNRFSQMGFIAVILIAVSAMINTGLHLSALHDLTATRYGILISLKIGLFSLMIGLAIMNRWITSRVASSFLNNNGSDFSLLLAGIYAEMAFALLILSVAALLGMTQP